MIPDVFAALVIGHLCGDEKESIMSSMDRIATKAQSTFRAAGGDPTNAGPLTRWVIDAHLRFRSDDTVGRTGVIVAHDGQIIAHTVEQGTGDQVKARYVTPVTDPAHAAIDVINTEMGLAMGSLRRLPGQDLIHVSYWDACTQLWQQ